jgi:outer membrane protein assembly factor BamD
VQKAFCTPNLCAIETKIESNFRKLIVSGGASMSGRSSICRIRNGLVTGIFMLGLMAGCNSFDSRAVNALEAFTARQIFDRGEFELERNQAEDAAFYFGEIERLYPYSEWAKRALIMQAFAYHRDTDYPNSRAAAQRYIDFYPADEDAAYAQYLLALSYYDQIDEIGRDQGLTFQALQALRVVIERYPETEYARSSVLKFDLIILNVIILRRLSIVSVLWLRTFKLHLIPQKHCIVW